MGPGQKCHLPLGSLAGGGRQKGDDEAREQSIELGKSHISLWVIATCPSGRLPGYHPSLNSGGMKVNATNGSIPVTFGT